MNPFKHIDGLYGAEQIKAWHSQDGNDESSARAHAYKVVERAYRGMSERQVDQSILVSGMSGAGKTETVKICINYLSSIGGVHSKLERRINDAGVALESFGNAFTVHNANSSRFGKYTKMFFVHGGGMVGAKLNTYLLEKTRVAHPPENERNFHIFYQMLHGLPDEVKANLHLTSVGDYQILATQPMRNSNGALAFATSNQAATDAKTYEALMGRLKGLGFEEDALDDLIRVLAGVLHLGNVRFGEKSNSENSDEISSESGESAKTGIEDGVSFVETPETLEIAAQLLGVDASALETALTKLALKTVNNTILPLSRPKALLARDSLIAEIYERLFSWIVSQLNESLAIGDDEDEDEMGYIAILDISGYESVSTNGFEQININYTNDKLMQLYNELLYAEQEEYEREFSWVPIEFDADLKSTIALIEKKPEGVLPLLDAICYRQDASDELFVTELGSFAVGTPRGNTRCIHSVNPDTLRFDVHHAPGPVQYNAKGFVVKNRDILAASLEQLMRDSKSALCASIFEKNNMSERSSSSSTSVAKMYMEQLSDLTDAIRETDYSFIKCVKPNAHNEPDRFNCEFIIDQVKWCGVIETLQVCSRGFPQKFTISSFAQMFAQLVDKDPQQVKDADTQTQLSIAKQIIQSCLNDNPREGAESENDENSQPQAIFGLTKLFLSMSALFKLQTLKKAKLESSSGWLTKAKSAFGWLWK